MTGIGLLEYWIDGLFGAPNISLLQSSELRQSTSERRGVNAVLAKVTGECAQRPVRRIAILGVLRRLSQ